MEVESPLRVEEWAFVQSALENEATDNLQVDSDRSQQVAPEHQVVKMILNKRLEKERKQIVRVKPIDTETVDWIVKLENENLQLHKMWKDQMTKRLDLEKKLQRLDSAHMKQYKESKRLRTICLHQAATLIDVYQKGCKQERNSLSRVPEQVKKVETMEHRILSEFNNGRKRYLETEKREMILMKAAKRLKRASPNTEMKELVDEPRVKVVKEKATNMQEDMKTRLVPSPDVETLELENDVWSNLPEEFGFLEAELDIDLMVVELTTNFDWNVEKSLTG